VPGSALVRSEGAVWVYRQSGSTEFERVPISLESPLEDGWFVSHGLKAGDQVVTTGAQALLSEELKGQAGE
jgi:hypothetical protein